RAPRASIPSEHCATIKSGIDFSLWFSARPQTKVYATTAQTKVYATKTPRDLIDLAALFSLVLLTAYCFLVCGWRRYRRFPLTRFRLSSHWLRLRIPKSGIDRREFLFDIAHLGCHP